jgi:SAM-dependent methyltransferase
MTDEQLSVANGAIGHHQKTFPEASPVEFKKGLIEDLLGAGIGDNSVDVVISNCVINLVPDKQKAFNEIFRVLKFNGEVCISDIFTDRPLSQAAREDRVLLGECLGNAVDINTFTVLMQNAGFDDIWPVHVSRVPVDGIPEDVVDPATVFFSITFSAFKFQDRKCHWNGDVATYQGGIEDCEEEFVFDLNHSFKKGEGVPVCSKLALALSVRFAPHFVVQKVEPIPSRPPTRSFMTTVIEEAGNAPAQRGGGCCCAGGSCGSGGSCC